MWTIAARRVSTASIARDVPCPVSYTHLLYAALSDPAWSGNARLFRYDGRRWQDLGSPSGASLFVPRRIVVFDAGVAVLAASYRAMTSYDLVGGAWSAGRLLGGVGGGLSLIHI